MTCGDEHLAWVFSHSPGLKPKSTQRVVWEDDACWICLHYRLTGVNFTIFHNFPETSCWSERSWFAQRTLNSCLMQMKTWRLDAVPFKTPLCFTPAPTPQLCSRWIPVLQICESLCNSDQIKCTVLGSTYDWRETADGCCLWGQANFSFRIKISQKCDFHRILKQYFCVFRFDQKWIHIIN